MLKKVETVLSVPWTKLTPSESKPLLHAYIGSIPLEGKKRMALKLAKRYMGKIFHCRIFYCKSLNFDMMKCRRQKCLCTFFQFIILA